MIPSMLWGSINCARFKAKQPMVRSSADILEIPASRETLSLLTVDRAISELRRGRYVVVRGNNASAALILAAEGVTPDNLRGLAQSAGASARLTITSNRSNYYVKH